jgi:hypothetical protein
MYIISPRIRNSHDLTGSHVRVHAATARATISVPRNINTTIASASSKTPMTINSTREAPIGAMRGLTPRKYTASAIAMISVSK